MNKTNQLWKFSWNPSGYKLVGIPIDITNKKEQDYFSLNHTYFNSKDFTIYTFSSTGNKVTYKCHEELKTNTDFLLDKKDDILSEIAGLSVYSRIKVISAKAAKQTKIFVDCTFLGDVLDPSSFNQDLTPESDVKHKSLILQDQITSPVAHMDDIQGQWGNLDKESFSVSSKNIQLGKSVISDTGYMLESSDPSFSLGKKNFNITFDEKEMTAMLNVGDKRNGIIIRGPKTIKDIPVFGIPVILSDDATKWGFVPWLTLDPDNKGIKIGNLNVEDNSFLSKDTLSVGRTLMTSSILMNNLPFITYNKSTGDVTMLDGIIQANVLSRTITINGITIDKNFIAEYKQLQKDVEYLKAKDK